MTVSEFIQEVIRRTGMKMAAFADKSDVSLNLISNVKNDNKPGTWKTIMGVIDAAELDIADCLTLPPDPKTASEDEAAIHILRMALRHHGGQRDRVYECIETLKRLREKEKGKHRKVVADTG